MFSASTKHLTIQEAGQIAAVLVRPLPTIQATAPICTSVNQRAKESTVASMNVAFVLPYQNNGLEPLGLLQASASLKRAGHQVLAVLPTKRSLARALREWQPDILAYSVITGWHQQYVELNHWARAEIAPGALSVFGGPHATHFPALIHETDVDAVCIGEGEIAFVDLLARLQRGSNHLDTPNWWIKQGGTIYRNPLREPIRDLDELPFADRHLLTGQHSYVNLHLRSFMASRGCVYNCSYCFNHAYRQLYAQDGYKVGVRRRSVDHLIAEILSVRESVGMRSVAFFDDVFVTEPEWLDRFSWEYSRKIGVPFECNLRVEQITDQAIVALKRAGCAIIALGIETADEATRAAVLRRRYSNEQLREASVLVREQGILLKTYNILGLPPGDLQAEWNTVDLNRSLDVAIPTASLFQPYPGTDLGEQTRKTGLWEGDIDTIGRGFYATSPLKLEHRHQIEVLQKLFFIGCKAVVALPLVRFLVRHADIGLVRWLVFAGDRTANRVGLFFGRNLAFAEEMRRRLLARLVQADQTSDGGTIEHAFPDTETNRGKLQ